MKPVKRILCIRIGAIGDVILTLPAFSLLRQNFPQAEIDVWVQEYTKELLENNEDINEILINPSLEKIKAKHYDLSIDFYGDELHYPLTCFRAKIPIRIADKEKTTVSFLNNHLVAKKMNDLTKHIVEHNIDLLQNILPTNYSVPLKIQVPEKGKLFLHTFLHQQHINENDLIIGIHLGTGKGNRAWLPEKFAEIIDCLIEKLHAKVIITGTKKEKSASLIVEEKCRFKPINLVEKTSLAELIGVFSRLNVYIGVDTGPMHLAAALKRPIVALFPSKFVKPSQWGPWQTRHIIIKKKTDCSITCLPRKCSFDYCLKTITPQDVIFAVEKLLAGKGNNTLEEAKIDWFKKSANILTNDINISHTLQKNNYNVTLCKRSISLKETIRILTSEAINIIHWNNEPIPLILYIARLITIPMMLFPALLIRRKSRDLSIIQILDLYKNKFKTRKYL